MKHLIFLTTVILSVLSFSIANGQTSPRMGKNIELFIKGHRYEPFFNLDTFKKGFVLQLSDPTYTIKQCNFNWTSAGGDINEVVLHDTVVNAATMHNSFDTAGGHFFFDNIIIERGGLSFRIPAESFTLVKSDRYNAIYDTLARNRAFIKDQSGEEIVVSASLFTNPFILGLRDTSYTVVSFDLILISQDEENDLLFHFNGDGYSPSTENRELALRRIRDNDMVLFTNIKARKDSSVYTVPDLSIIIREDRTVVFNDFIYIQCYFSLLIFDRV